MKARIQAALVSLVALSLALGACSRSDDVAKQRTAAQTPTSPSVPPSSQSTPTTTPSSSDTTAQTPSPSTASSQDANSAETAKASDTPMSAMDKQEETKSMPQPGQANDHSTLAQDPKAPK